MDKLNERAEELPLEAPPAETPVVKASEVKAESVEAADTVERRHRHQLMGKVVSAAPEKTAVVAVTRTYLHPKVRKYVRRSKKYMVHDVNNDCAVGDEVLIEECRPLSKNKRWRLRKITRKHL